MATALQNDTLHHNLAHIEILIFWVWIDSLNGRWDNHCLTKLPSKFGMRGYVRRCMDMNYIFLSSLLIEEDKGLISLGLQDLSCIEWTLENL